MMQQVLAGSAIILLLALTQSLANAADRVQFVFPSFIGARLDQGGVNVFTRAGKFRMPADFYDLANASSGVKMTRLEEYEPSELYHYDRCYALNGRDSRCQDIAKAASKKLGVPHIDHEDQYNFQIATESDSQTLFQQGIGIWKYPDGSRYIFRIRGENYYYNQILPDAETCLIGQNCISGNVMELFRKHAEILENWSPITSFVLISSNENKNHSIILFDGLGRAIQSDVIMKNNLRQAENFNVTLEIGNLQIVQLGLDKNPFSFKTNYSRMDLWEGGSQRAYQLVPGDDAFQEYFSKIRATKFQFTMLDAVATMYNTANVTDPEDPVALCYSPGIRYFDDSKNSKDLVTCQFKSENYANRMVSFNLGANISRSHVQAFAIIEYEKRAYIYMVVQLVQDTGSDPPPIAAVCKLRSPMSPSNMSTNLDAYKLSDCDTKNAITPPSDIVSLSAKDVEGKDCSKVVWFYENLYIIYWPGQLLGDSSPEVDREIYDAKFKFFIRAAWAVKNTVYFSTHTNTLVLMDAIYEKKCKGIQFTYKKEMLAHDYFLKQFGKIDYIGEPALIEYREYSNNTFKPGMGPGAPILNRIPGDKVSTTPKPSPTENKSSGSKVGIIIIAIVLGGLIVAGLIYMFCLRGDNSATSRKSRRSAGKSKRRSPIVSNESLAMKTTRSTLPAKTTAPSVIAPVANTAAQPQPVASGVVDANRQAAKHPEASGISGPGSKAPTSPRKSVVGRPNSPGTSGTASSAASSKVHSPSGSAIPLAKSVAKSAVVKNLVGMPTNQSPGQSASTGISRTSASTGTGTSVSPKSPKSPMSPKSPKSPNSSKMTQGSKVTTSPKSPNGSKMFKGSKATSSAKSLKSPKSKVANSPK